MNEKYFKNRGKTPLANQKTKHNSEVLREIDENQIQKNDQYKRDVFKKKKLNQTSTKSKSPAKSKRSPNGKKSIEEDAAQVSKLTQEDDQDNDDSVDHYFSDQEDSSD